MSAFEALYNLLYAFFTGLFKCEYLKPVTNFKQLINGDIHGQYGAFIKNTENTIQLSWDWVHFYHGYEFYWWTDANPSKRKFYISPLTLYRSRLNDVEYYSFTDETPNTYVYYIQLQGWLYGRGHGNISEVLKTYKPYICLLYTSPSPRDKRQSRMPSSA